MTYNAARLQEEGKQFVKEAAMAKVGDLHSCQLLLCRVILWMVALLFVGGRESVVQVRRDARRCRLHQG